mmetsp:Transcript_26575/g.63719  ORF Transcript_26575/g.63719 Transcript_26575/m.63719 type:complete len:667 (+) Transcript_26575:36-2036(+)
MNIASIAVATTTILAISAALFSAHREQNNRIRNLSRQLSEVLDRIPPLAVSDDNHALSSPLSTSGSGRRLPNQLVELPTAFTYASEFGVVGDSMADDGPALQAAIDSAATGASGGTVIIPQGVFFTAQSLVIPGGVTLQGMGYGSSPLAIKFDAGGSTIAYCGTDHAVKITGSSSGLRDVAVYDWPYNHGDFDGGCPDVTAAGGVLVKADGVTVESVFLSNVFIYFFVGGDALSLVAVNQGGVGYGNYQNLRLRHARTGLKLAAEVGSFVNTNTFVGGAISGGDFHYGIHATGPGPCNDNKFYGLGIGMYDSEVAHVYVTGSSTNIKLENVRIEARGKDMSRPVVIIDDSSYGNVINGILGHTHVRANMNRNPDIDVMSQKTVGLDPAPVNQFWNAAFKGWVAENRVMPGWKLEHGQANIVVLDQGSDSLYPDHNVISVDYLNYGGAFKLMSDQTLKVHGHDFVTFGIYAKSSIQGSISAVMRYTSGSIISSASHSGSGEWEFIGMSALYDKNAPYFYFSITGDVQVTAPALTFGQTPATPGASLMSSSGARMSGTFTLGSAIGLPPATELNTPYYWVLPKNEGNVFMMDMQGNPFRHIHRLNHSGADRFPRGTVITMVFEEAGTRVKSTAYIKLKNDQDFVSVVQSSLTLVTKGSATWYEVSRNN